MTRDNAERFTFREATPEELVEARKNHASAWAGGLTVEQYLGREVHIASQDLTRNGGIKFWVLTDDSHPPKLLCSCETIEKDAIVKSASASCRMVRSHIVGSVFTPVCNRGKGYASVMLQKLGEVLVAENCLFDSLYSDVGKKFYARWGWMPYESAHISLPPAVEDSGQHGEDIIPLLAKDLDGQNGLCSRDVENTIRDFETRPLASNVDHRIAYLPTHEVMRWHHAREEYVGMHLTGKTPLVKGAMAKRSGKRWCVWTRTFNNVDESLRRLSILRMVDEEEYQEDGDEDARVEETADLLREAQREAKVWGMKEVTIWNPSKRVINASKRVMEGKDVPVIQREEDSITSLRWNGPGGNTAKIQWDLNEKFSWC